MANLALNMIRLLALGLLTMASIIMCAVGSTKVVHPWSEVVGWVGPFACLGAAALQLRKGDLF